jgi:hypothetical protein
MIEEDSVLKDACSEVSLLVEVLVVHALGSWLTRSLPQYSRWVFDGSVL